MKKSTFIFLFFLSMVLLNSKYYEIKYNTLENGISDSLIALTIDNTPANNFPSKKSGLAIDSIICDKGANGVWDYQNWLLKVRNITENRTKCQINFVTKYTESILRGTDPVLKEGLIPVIINDEGVVTKSSEGWEWYDYETQKWANAIILNDETKTYYDGDIIPEEDIESYFVWIPRYRYRLFDKENGNYEGFIDISNLTSKAQEILIEFENKTTTPSNGSNYGEWLTHPAFTAFDSNGMWVGKFETGYKGATISEEAEKNVNESESIQIKPNVYSWRNIQVVKAYLSSYNYKREMDSHMMKNTEWGAVAYLQHSKYGSQESVRINNNSAHLTGYGAVSEPTTGYNEYKDYGETLPGESSDITRPWNTDSGVLASTTGNISGVYDMSGGTLEYVMGVMLDKTNTKPCSGRNAENNSGFNGPYSYDGGEKKDGMDYPLQKYYDVYPYYPSVVYGYYRRILGDATAEMGPFARVKYGTQYRNIGSWYNDEANFIFSDDPWFIRGSSFTYGSFSGIGAGIFTFGTAYGSATTRNSFRVVLVF